MIETMRRIFILLLIIPALAIIPACAKKTTMAEQETSPQIDQAALDREKELAAESKRKEAERRRFLAAKRQFQTEDIYFKKGSYQLQPQARTILYRKAEFLKTYPDVVVIIEGHTDERGTREANIAFGDHRAGAVKSFLIREGIARERLIPISFGKERPVDTGRTEAARAKNRRVHFVIKE